MEAVFGGIEHAWGADEAQQNHTEVEVAVEETQFRFNDVAGG